MNKLAEDNEVVNSEIITTDIETTKEEEKKPEIQDEEKPEKPKTSIEYEYGLTVKLDKDIRKINTENDSKVFQWKQNHWALMTDQQGKIKASTWLDRCFKQASTAKMANSCHQTLKLKVSDMPNDTDETIIPLQNKWLKVVNNEFQIVEPNREVKVCYVINTNLHFKPNAKIYTPTALSKTSKFHNYLNTSLPNKAVQDLVQEYCGYTLLNDNRFQKALVMEGEGANGKSIIIELMRNLHQNSRSIRMDKLDNFGLTPLLDASLVISAETPKKKINEEILKGAISGDLMTIEGKGKDLFSHKPKAKWLIACNTFPHIEDKTDGVLRRLIIVPFERIFADNEQIKDLDKQIIKEELNIVLNWCLEGLQRLLKRGNFLIPDEIAKVKKTKQEECDPVRRFVSEYGVATSKDCNLPKQELYDHYRAFTENEGSPSCSQEEFGKRIKRLFPNIQEQRKVVAGIGSIRVRCVNLQLGCYDPEPSKPVKSDEQPKADVCPTPTITEPTEEAKQLVHAYRVEVLTQKADALLNAPEPTESKVWFINGNRYTFKPKYLKDLSEAVATIPFDPSNPLCVIYAIEQKIKAKTATTEEKEHLAKLELTQKEQAKLTTSQEQE